MNRSEAYTLISDLVFTGFITTSVTLEGKVFVFKSMNARELDLMKMFVGGRSMPDFSERFNVFYVIYSILAIDGENILNHPDRRAGDLYPFLSSMPDMIFAKISKELSSLRRDVYETVKFLEGFSYTMKSRHKWKSNKGHLPNDEKLTGICGTGRIGLNIHQENWLSINQMLDREESYNRDFSLALMVASASNPKGVKKIGSQHDQSIQNAEERRSKLAEEGYVDKKSGGSGWTAPVDTADELVAELERQMQGKKDKHDIFIEKYMDRLKEEADNRKKEAEDNIRRAREGMEESSISGEQRVLSPEEAQDLMKRKRKGLVTVQDEGYVSPDDKDKFYRKIGSRVLTGRR